MELISTGGNTILAIRLKLTGQKLTEVEQFFNRLRNLSNRSNFYAYLFIVGVCRKLQLANCRNRLWRFIF